MGYEGKRTSNLDPADTISEFVGHTDLDGSKTLARIPFHKAAAQFEAARGPKYETKAELFADLDWIEGTEARVWGDPVLDDRGIYRKDAAPGSGPWTRIGPLPETDLSHSLRVPDNESIQPFPDAATRANTVPIFDSEGNPTAGPTAAEIESAEAHAIAAIAAKNDIEALQVTSGLLYYSHQGSYQAGTSYNQSEAVTGSDGNWYRMQLTNAVGVDPVGDNTGTWLPIPKLPNVTYLQQSYPRLFWPALTGDIASTEIPSSVVGFETLGRTESDGISGLKFKRLAGEPGTIDERHQQSADGSWWQAVSTEVYPQAFASGDADSNETPGNGTAADAGIAAWWAYLKRLGQGGVGRLSGSYRVAENLTFNLTGLVHGISIIGDRVNGSGFIMDPNKLHKLIAPTNGATQDSFYTNLRYKVRGNNAGPVFQIGENDFSDAHGNSAHWEFVVNNDSLNAAAEALRFNYCVGVRGMITANCGGSGRPGTPTAPGAGVAILARQLQFANLTLFGGSAYTGIEYRDGYSFGNEIMGDFEEVNTALRINSANAIGNTFTSAQALGLVTIDATAGYGNVVETNVNLSNYAGGTLGTNLVGIELRKRVTSAHPGYTSEPALPASGAIWTNNTGYIIPFQVAGGAFTVVTLHAPDGGTTAYAVPTNYFSGAVPNQWGFSITYSSAPTLYFSSH